jgi:hypothetical protein
MNGDDLEAKKIGRLVAGIHRAARDRAIFQEGMTAGMEAGRAEASEEVQAAATVARSAVRTCRLFTWISLGIFWLNIAALNHDWIARHIHAWMEAVPWQTF